MIFRGATSFPTDSSRSCGNDGARLPARAALVFPSTFGDLIGIDAFSAR
jgi:hypothetical protein